MRKPLDKRVGDILSPISTGMMASAPSTTMIDKSPKLVGGKSKPLNNGECLIARAKSMVAMTRILKGSNKDIDNLLATRNKISNAKTTSIEISNIKQA